ncbi:MAG TPA: hypothetical protein VKA46_41960 [Gemmataceae bacterium]|nr:hypothetical protein [Gemmataceae bacterium]
MSTTYELRDLDEARQFLAQALWLQRVRAPAAAMVRPLLRWALEIAAAGQALPPVGFVADLGHAALGADWEAKSLREAVHVPGLPPGLMRTYEDYVLGKLYADWTFARAGDALRRYQGEGQERDQARGLAFLLNQFRGRADFAGVELSPGVIKALLECPPQEALAQGWDSLSREGLHPLLEELYQSLIAASRRTAEVLAPEDVFELEHGTALAEFGERVALRQVLQGAARLEATLPVRRIRPLAGRQEVPTRVLDEDSYPVGGFSSLSTRGSVESLLHSQLAFMETDDRPDLFDVKFLRDELLYYARDENQFLRRRRSFVLALFPDLRHTRVKDPSLPYQRGILLLALILVVVRRLSDWLSTDALLFEFLFVRQEDEKGEPLERERELLEMLFREPIENGTVVLRTEVAEKGLAKECAERARRSLCHCLTLSTRDQPFEAQDTVVTRLSLEGPCPALGAGDEEPIYPEGEEPFDVWAGVLLELLQRWI